MQRTLISVACAASLALSSAPAFAACNADAACGRGGGPISLFVPPVDLQQIETASTPIALPQPEPSVEPDAAVPSAAERRLFADLNGGIADWLLIEPKGDFASLPATRFTAVRAVDPARHTRPRPQVTAKEVGAFLAISVPIKVERSTVPGIEPGAPGFGNRSLWFLAARR